VIKTLPFFLKFCQKEVYFVHSCNSVLSRCRLVHFMHLAFCLLLTACTIFTFVCACSVCPLMTQKSAHIYDFGNEWINEWTKEERWWNNTDGQYCNFRRNVCPNTTLIASNLIRTGLELIPVLLGQWVNVRPVLPVQFLALGNSATCHDEEAQPSGCQPVLCCHRWTFNWLQLQVQVQLHSRHNPRDENVQQNC
jgi:hypothetical protein